MFALSVVVGSMVNLKCLVPCKWRSKCLTLFYESSVGAVRSRASSFVAYAMSGRVHANH